MSGGVLGVSLNAQELAYIADRLGANDGNISWALRGAATHAARLAQRLGKAQLRSGLSISAETLRRRLKLSTAQGRRSDGTIRFSSAQSAHNLRARARVWFGLNPVDPFKLTTPPVWSSDIKTRTSGVTAGRYRWDGAFIARRRKGRSAEAGREAVFMRKGANRLPIVRQFAEINAKSLEVITGNIFPLVAPEFYRKFEQLLIIEMERSAGAR